MKNKLKKVLKQGYEELKKSFDKLLKPRGEKNLPQPALQPYRVRKNF